VGRIKGILLQLVMVTIAAVLFVANEHGCHSYNVHYEHVIVHLIIKNKHIMYCSIKEGSNIAIIKK
jgi:hypothetical protein